MSLSHGSHYQTATNMEQLTYVVPAGKRTYYFDLHESRQEYQYLTITETVIGPDGATERHRIMVFEEYIPAFVEGIRKILGIEESTPQHKAYDIKQIRENHPKAYKPWSREEDERLLRLADDGVSQPELAHIFQRNQGAIRSRLKKLLG